MPLLATGTDYVPIFHLGAVGGIKPPFWDQHDEFGDTNMLVVKPEEGASLARALGSHWMVLMKRHGVTVAGTSVQRLRVPLRSIRRAMPNIRCAPWPSAATSPRCRRAKPSWPAQITAKTTGLMRSWEYWSMRVAKAGGAPAAPPKSQGRKRQPQSRAARRKRGGAEI